MKYRDIPLTYYLYSVMVTYALWAGRVTSKRVCQNVC